jgi:hypothetical protein
MDASEMAMGFPTYITFITYITSITFFVIA